MRAEDLEDIFKNYTGAVVLTTVKQTTDMHDVIGQDTIKNIAIENNNSQNRRIRGDADLNPGMTPLRDPLTPASVLVPVVVRDDGLHILLTQRTDHLRDHAGQISFPGGRYEADDGHPLETALRETEEEIGLSRQHIECIGALDSYVTRTGFDVTPIVGLVRPPFELKLDAFEVAEAFEVPLSFFLNRRNHQRRQYKMGVEARCFYEMPFEDYHIWGATAGMIVNFIDIIEGE